MKKNEPEDRFIKRLNILISLMLDIVSKENPAQTTEKVERLLGLGLTPAEVGEILDKPTNYVTAVMNTKKKKAKKKG